MVKLKESSNGAKRRTARCLNCGEPREIAAHGLCFACYRREERASDGRYVDRHNPGVTPDQKKILNGFAKLMAGLGDIGVPRGTVLLIRKTIQPYLVPVQDLLSPPASRETDAFPAEAADEKSK
jgi:hypothetical protein